VGAVSVLAVLLLWQVASTLAPGDSLITNDPWIGTSQLNDMVFVSPIFHRGRIVGYAANIAHSPDVGGRLLSADSRELFEEGLRLPIAKLIERGRPNQTIVDIIRANVRVPDIVVGDLFAQEAANTAMIGGVLDFLVKEGRPDLRALSREILGRSEKAMRAAIARLPDGTYDSVVETDGFDTPLELRARVTVAGDELSVDFTGTSPQQGMGINCTFNYAYAETVFPLICLCAPDSPINGGTLRPLRVSAPDGTILSATHPAPLGGRLLVSMYVQCAIFRALAVAVPDRVLADCAAPAWTPVVQGINQHGQRFVDIVFLNGGLGARPDRDGVDVLGFPGNLSGTLVEIFENEKPMLVERREIAEETAGAGRYRGGAGLHFSVRSESDTPITVGLRADRLLHPAQGLQGGGAGAPGLVLLKPRVRPLPQRLRGRSAGPSSPGAALGARERPAQLRRLRPRRGRSAGRSREGRFGTPSPPAAPGRQAARPQAEGRPRPRPAWSGSALSPSVARHWSAQRRAQRPRPSIAKERSGGTWS